jgi:hypothetical protein
MMSVAEFLQHPYNFSLGVSLLELHDPQNHVLPKLKKGYTIMNEKLLLAQLRPLATKKSVVLPTVTPSLSVPSETLSLAVTTTDAKNELLDKVRSLKQEKARLFAEAVNAHRELTDLPLSKKDRFLRAQLIDDHFQRIDTIWLALDFFDRFGKLPAAESDKDNFAAGLEIQHRILNLRTYISRYKKQLLTAKSPVSKASVEEKLQRYSFELKHLEKEALCW